jgi:hypothetical protein
MFLGNCRESSISLGCFIKSLDDFLVRDELVFGDYYLRVIVGLFSFLTRVLRSSYVFAFWETIVTSKILISSISKHSKHISLTTVGRKIVILS